MWRRMNYSCCRSGHVPDQKSSAGHEDTVLQSAAFPVISLTAPQPSKRIAVV